MGIPIKKKFSDRQNILDVLYAKYEENIRPNADELDIMVSFSKLAFEAKVTDDVLRRELEFLSNESELTEYEFNYTSSYLITTKGRSSAVDNKYKKLGEDDFWNSVKNYIAVIALVLSIGIAIWNIYNSNEIEKLKNRILILENKK